MLGDITNGEDILKFQQLIGLKPVDVVLSDVAPEISGDAVYDNYHVQNLNNHVLAASNRILRPGGSLLMKSFYGIDEPGQFKFFQTLFKEFYRVKPNASRKRSAEIYYLGRPRRRRKGLQADRLLPEDGEGRPRLDHVRPVLRDVSERVHQDSRRLQTATHPTLQVLGEHRPREYALLKQ